MTSWTVSIEWLADGSELELRRALSAALPGVPVTTITTRRRYVGSNQLYWRGTAVVNDELVVKVAWSQVRAHRLHREGVLLTRLRAAAPALRLPELVVVHDCPVLVATKRLVGAPLGWGNTSELADPTRVERIALDLAEFMTTLHDLSSRLLDGLPPVVPTAQSDTGLLRSRYGSLVDAARARRVADWCDWIDDVLAMPDDQVVVHGDLHGDNTLWDDATGTLLAVVDFEECGIADRSFDFRYLPGTLGSTDLVRTTIDSYEHRSGRRLDVDRIMAWHALTVLGDASWRTAAGIGLPGGGDARSYVDDLQRRFDDMRVGR
jgi:aminoglycoside phosphotransferase (APT) family kinase protein